jgi:hypothetical protein
VIVQVVIMGHPKRAEMIGDLMKKLHGNALLALDPVPDEPGCWECAKLAWITGAESDSVSHVAVIQDDVTVCRDFQLTLERIATGASTTSKIWALYANSAKVTEAREVGKHYTSIDGLWGQGVMMPASYVPDFLRWGDEEWQHPDGALPGAYYDSRMGAWARARRIPMYACVPSLVDHLAPSDSLLGYNNRTRVARHYLGDHISGLTVWK